MRSLGLASQKNKVSALTRLEPTSKESSPHKYSVDRPMFDLATLLVLWTPGIHFGNENNANIGVVLQNYNMGA